MNAAEQATFLGEKVASFTPKLYERRTPFLRTRGTRALVFD